MTVAGPPNRPRKRRRPRPLGRVSRAKLAVARKNTRRKTVARRSPWRRRLLMAALVLLGSTAGIVGTAAFGFRWFRDRPAPAVGGEGWAPVSWPDGLDARESAKLLRDLGLTDNAPAMELYLRVVDGAACAVPGPHLLPLGASPRQLVAALCRDEGRPKVKLTIPEGFHRFAIATRLEKLGVASRDAFLYASADTDLLWRLGITPAAIAEASTAEGYLFPATYSVHIDSAPAEVVALLVAEADRRWERAIRQHAGGWEKLQAEHDMDRHAVITLASMVEKEAVVPEERPIIASVFLNRLLHPEFPHLQSDPTSLYGCYVMPEQIAACADFDGKPSGALNRDPGNIYSTYVSAGLPPGPVANPGSASIEAVLAPAETRYLYFVARGEGRHAFSESYDDHNAAVQRLRALRAR